MYSRVYKVSIMQHQETKVDPLAKALNLLQTKVAIGAMVPLAALGLKKGGDEFFITCVKMLIDAGWCEYEFTDDYKGVRRLNLPDFAKTHFKELKYEYDNKK